MARKAFTDHPEFTRASAAANAAIAGALADMGCELCDLNAIDPHVNRVADDFTRLLLRAFDAKQKRAA